MIPSFVKQKGTFVPLAGNSEWDKLVANSSFDCFPISPIKTSHGCC